MPHPAEAVPLLQSKNRFHLGMTDRKAKAKAATHGYCGYRSYCRPTSLPGQVYRPKRSNRDVFFD